MFLSSRPVTEMAKCSVNLTHYVYPSRSTPRPIAVEALEQKDDEDGNPEKFINKTPEFLK